MFFACNGFFCLKLEKSVEPEHHEQWHFDISNLTNPKLFFYCLSSLGVFHPGILGIALSKNDICLSIPWNHASFTKVREKLPEVPLVFYQ